MVAMVVVVMIVIGVAHDNNPLCAVQGCWSKALEKGYGPSHHGKVKAACRQNSGAEP
jgi:hypothetical protein